MACAVLAWKARANEGVGWCCSAVSAHPAMAAERITVAAMPCRRCCCCCCC